MQIFAIIFLICMQICQFMESDFNLDIEIFLNKMPYKIGKICVNMSLLFLLKSTCRR